MLTVSTTLTLDNDPTGGFPYANLLKVLRLYVLDFYPREPSPSGGAVAKPLFELTRLHVRLQDLQYVVPAAAAYNKDAIRLVAGPASAIASNDPTYANSIRSYELRSNGLSAIESEAIVDFGAGLRGPPFFPADVALSAERQYAVYLYPAVAYDYDRPPTGAEPDSSFACRVAVQLDLLTITPSIP